MYSGNSSSPSKGMCLCSRLLHLLTTEKGIRFTFLSPSDQAKFEQLFIQGAAQFGGNQIGGMNLFQYCIIVLTLYNSSGSRRYIEAFKP